MNPEIMEPNTLLIKACLANDRASQKQLYYMFAGQMLGVCNRYTKSLADAEDIMQEGFIKTFKNLHQYKAEGELGAWIRKIMVNTALSYLKRNAKYQQELAFEKLEMHPLTDDNPELLLDSKELLSLIKQLPAGYQVIFNLYAVEGYNHLEIGEMLGITDGTSRSQYSRARALLISWVRINYSDSNKKKLYVR